MFAKDPRTGKVAAIPEGSLVSFNVISRTLVSSDGHAVVLDPEAFEQAAGRLTRKGGWLTFLDAGGALNSGLRVSAVSSINEESRTVRLGANVSFVLGPSPDGPDFQEVFEALTGAARERSGSPGAPCKPSSATLAEMARDLRACIEPSVSATSPTSSTFPTQRCPPLTVLPADPADDSMSDCAEGPAGILPLKRIG